MREENRSSRLEAQESRRKGVAEETVVEKRTGGGRRNSTKAWIGRALGRSHIRRRATVWVGQRNLRHQDGEEESRSRPPMPLSRARAAKVVSRKRTYRVP